MYYDKVAKPMDLSTMDQKIKEHGYTTVQQFREDLQLLYDNSVLFNGSNSHYTLKAQEILDTADQLISEKAVQVISLFCLIKYFS